LNHMKSSSSSPKASSSLRSIFPLLLPQFRPFGGYLVYFFFLASSSSLFFFLIT